MKSIRPPSPSGACRWMAANGGSAARILRLRMGDMDPVRTRVEQGKEAREMQLVTE